ncbi:hypothetical protein E3N88_16748 [Mikania micrantha]|uniref:Uncharacterized protein n=1 Tax=Mikania micrantha TaxID=192012 RepID=A0A5N6NPT7_9ASTR|nr:hypothetical protein E3N88_16748 [Mikania micrantha]
MVARAFLYLPETRIDKRHRRVAKWVLHHQITVEDLLAADINNNGFLSIQSLESRDVAADSVSELSPYASLRGLPKRYFKLFLWHLDTEDTDWKRAHDMIKTTRRGKV